MSHQDKDGRRNITVNHQALRQALDWLLTPTLFSGIAFRNDCTWSPFLLVAAALLWAWSDEKNLTDRFFTARKIIIKAFRLQRQPAGSYQAFTKMLCRWTSDLLDRLRPHLRYRMRTALKACYRIEGYILFGVDGSRVELPRTESNEKVYAYKKHRRRRKGKRRGKKTKARRKQANSPQMWLTTMWHVGSGLPWDWRHGPSDSSERDHLLQMIGGLPAGAMVTADGGFVGYEYWKALKDAGHQFLIRVGANVRLLKKLGYVRESNHIVYLWPDKAASKELPPLVLRLIVVHTGKHPMYLVTNVLSTKTLSDKKLVAIYGRRWGVELFYRSFKQTFERNKLRSHAARNAEMEIDWSLVGLWAVCLYAQRHLTEAKVAVERMSVAGVLRAIRKPMREYKSKPDDGEDLWSLLPKAVIDDYERTCKTSRDYPRRKNPKKPPGEPEIVTATKTQIELANEIKRREQLEERLTA
jgi:hypothetical protein